MIRPTSVRIMLKRTVFFLPILFINILVGTENIKNQRKTVTENVLATVSDNVKSCFTWLVAIPTKSTKPIVKKASMMGMILLILYLFSIMMWYKFILMLYVLADSPIDSKKSISHTTKWGCIYTCCYHVYVWSFFVEFRRVSCCLLLKVFMFIG